MIPPHGAVGRVKRNSEATWLLCKYKQMVTSQQICPIFKITWTTTKKKCWIHFRHAPENSSLSKGDKRLPKILCYTIHTSLYVKGQVPNLVFTQILTTRASWTQSIVIYYCDGDLRLNDRNQKVLPSLGGSQQNKGGSPRFFDSFYLLHQKYPYKEIAISLNKPQLSRWRESLRPTVWTGVRVSWSSLVGRLCHQHLEDHRQLGWGVDGELRESVSPVAGFVLSLHSFLLSESHAFSKTCLYAPY